MGDFYQHGVVTTLHNLSDRPVEAIEQDLIEFSKKRPMALLLPLPLFGARRAGPFQHCR